MAAPPTIRLHPDDSVVIARATLLPGAPVADNVTSRDRVPAGHKVATRAIATGEAVRRYGQIIGFASDPSRRGATCTRTTWAWAISPRTKPMARMLGRPRIAIRPRPFWAFAAPTGASPPATTSVSSPR